MSAPLQDSIAYRVLCVDDDPDILHLLRKTFQAAGFEVATCESGEAALRWIEREIASALAARVDIVPARIPASIRPMKPGPSRRLVMTPHAASGSNGTGIA